MLGCSFSWQLCLSFPMTGTPKTCSDPALAAFWLLRSPVERRKAASVPSRGNPAGVGKTKPFFPLQSTPCSPAVGSTVHPLGRPSFPASSTGCPGCCWGLSWGSASSCPTQRTLCHHILAFYASQTKQGGAASPQNWHWLGAMAAKMESPNVARAKNRRPSKVRHTQHTPHVWGPAEGLKHTLGCQALATSQCPVKVPVRTQVSSTTRPPCPFQHLLNFAQPQLCSRLQSNRTRWWHEDQAVSTIHAKVSQSIQVASRPPLSHGHEACLARKESLNLQFYKYNKLS